MRPGGLHQRLVPNAPTCRPRPWLKSRGRGYAPIDITGTDARLYSLTCPLYLGLIIAAIPKYSKGKLELVPRNREGKPMTSRVEALESPRDSSPYLLPPPGTMDASSVAVGAGASAPREIKEWQAIMDYMRNLPARATGELPVIPVDDRAAEVRAIKE